jgi:hypothetical protein
MDKTEAEFYRLCLLSGILSNTTFKEEIIQRIGGNETTEQLFELGITKNRNDSIEILNTVKGEYEFGELKTKYYHLVYKFYKNDPSEILCALNYLYYFKDMYWDKIDSVERSCILSIDDELEFKKPSYYGEIDQIHWMFIEFMKFFLETSES